MPTPQAGDDLWQICIMLAQFREERERVPNAHVRNGARIY